MEQIIVEVNYNKGLWCRATKHQFSKQRKFYLMWTVLLGICNVIGIVCTIFFKNSSYTEGWPVFAFLFFLSILVISRFSSRSISKMIDKNLPMYPLKSKYTFSEDHFIIETDFQTAHSKTQYEYSSILSIHMIDKKTLYILLNNNTYSAIESDKCDEIVNWLRGKLAERCFDNQKKN